MNVEMPLSRSCNRCGGLVWRQRGGMFGGGACEVIEARG